MRVALYARVSSEKQDTDFSLSAQLKALREYASRNGHTVVREFVDEAETGRTDSRPAFKEMIFMARRLSNPFEAILVWRYSRFARSREDSIVYKTLLRKHGVQVISITEPFEDTPTGRLLEAMIESLDEFYSANLGQEVLRGMRESASRGFYVASHTPYGYRRVKVRDGNKDRPKLEVHSHQATVVARIGTQADWSGVATAWAVESCRPSASRMPESLSWIGRPSTRCNLCLRKGHQPSCIPAGRPAATYSAAWPAAGTAARRWLAKTPRAASSATTSAAPSSSRVLAHARPLISTARSLRGW